MVLMLMVGVDIGIHGDVGGEVDVDCYVDGYVGIGTDDGGIVDIVVDWYAYNGLVYVVFTRMLTALRWLCVC